MPFASENEYFRFQRRQLYHSIMGRVKGLVIDFINGRD
jgi:hypothetical protein